VTTWCATCKREAPLAQNRQGLRDLRRAPPLSNWLKYAAAHRRISFSCSSGRLPVGLGHAGTQTVFDVDPLLANQLSQMKYPADPRPCCRRLLVRLTCGVLGLSTDAFNKWRRNPVSERDLEGAHLINAAIDRPHRYYTSSQIMGYAWSDAALFPEEVRNYVSRLRKILTRLEIPCDLVNRPGRGSSLTFRNAD
jgi:hypothetical protein